MISLFGSLKAGLHILYADGNDHRPTLGHGRDHIKQEAGESLTLRDEHGR